RRLRATGRRRATPRARWTRRWVWRFPTRGAARFAARWARRSVRRLASLSFRSAVARHAQMIPARDASESNRRFYFVDAVAPLRSHRRMPPFATIPIADEADERVAVIIPCFNEEAAIAKVVSDFRRVLPEARVLVVDNYSTDATVERARSAGAEVLRESRKGKGFAPLRGFVAARDADVFVLVDGDDTYHAEDVGRLIGATQNGAEMAIG